MENEPQACEPQATARQEDDGRWRKGSPWQFAGFILVINVAITGISALMSGVLPPMGVFLSMSSIAGISAGLSAVIAWNIKRSQWLGFALASVIVSIITAGILSVGMSMSIALISITVLGMSMSIALISIIVWSNDKIQWMEYLVLLVLIGIIVGGLTLMGRKVSGVYSNVNVNYMERNYNYNYNVDPPAREYNEADKSRNYLPLIRK